MADTWPFAACGQPWESRDCGGSDQPAWSDPPRCCVRRNQIKGLAGL